MKGYTNDAQKSDVELTQLQLDILLTAVRLARDENLRNVGALTSRLKNIWPKKPKSIRVAITYWANYEVSKPRSAPP